MIIEPEITIEPIEPEIAVENLESIEPVLLVKNSETIEPEILINEKTNDYH